MISLLKVALSIGIVRYDRECACYQFSSFDKVNQRGYMRDNRVIAKTSLASVLLIVSAWLLAVSPCTARDNRSVYGMAVLPANLKLDWSLVVTYGTQGKCTAVCTLMTNLAMNQTAQEPTLCGLLESPEAKKAGVILPAWKKQDYRTHEDEIQKSILTNIYSQDDLMERMRARYPSESEEQVKNRIWSQNKTLIMQLFERGAAEYDISSFDIDSDGAPETISRISGVEPLIEGLAGSFNGQVDWRVRTCRSRGKDVEFNIYLNELATKSSDKYIKQLNSTFRLAGEDLAIFKYRATSYLVTQDSTVSTSVRSGDYYVTEIQWVGIFDKRKTTVPLPHVGWVNPVSRN